MSQKQKPARLWPNRKRGKYFILDFINGKRVQISTGCPLSEAGKAEAERKLSEYTGQKHETRIGEHSPTKLPIADVLSLYNDIKRPLSSRPKDLDYFLKPLALWWGNKMVSEIRGETCRAYAHDRTTPQQARRELEILRAAVGLYHKEYVLEYLPSITLPEKAKPRQTWLSKEEFERALRAAYEAGNDHLARFLLIGIYTGSRRGAILGLQWFPNTTSGYVDLEKGVMYRAGIEEHVAENKRRPPVKLNPKLLEHMKEWREADGDIRPIVHYHGRAVHDLRTSWERMRRDAGLGEHITPHVLRHSAATWLMQAGVPINEAAGFLGMTVQTLERVYSHHRADYQENAANAY